MTTSGAMPQSGNRLVDSHCHFDFPEFDGGRQQLVDQCLDAGLVGIVVPGTTAANWDRIQQLTQRFGLVRGAYGLHPYFINEHRAGHLDDLDQWLGQHDAIAVGEVGLDLYSNDLDLAAQQFWFEAQITIASNHHKPLIIHARKSYDQVVKSIRKAGFIHGGIIHGFSGSLHQAEKLTALGFKIGFGGAVTYERANRLRHTISQLPLEAIVIETDAPDMRPSFAREIANSPLHLPKIADYIAAAAKVPVETLVEASYQNVCSAFNVEFIH